MIEIEKTIFNFFRLKEVYYAKRPYDTSGFHSLRFNCCSDKIDRLGSERKLTTTLIIDLEKSLSEIWKNMDKSSCKYSIRRAQREGVKIHINRFYDEFCRIDKMFRSKKGLVPSFISPSFLRKYGTLFTIEYNRKILGGEFFVHDKDHMCWYIGASLRLHVNRKEATIIGHSNKLAIWEAIKYAKNKGIRFFDFGGYSLFPINREHQGVNFFKKSFGGKLVKQYNYVKFYSDLFKTLYNFGVICLKSKSSLNLFRKFINMIV